MGNEITGYAIAIDGLVASIKAAEKKFDDLAATSEKTRTKIVAHFKEMGDNGVDYFIKKIEEAKKALGGLGNVKINLNTNIAATATQDADAINKLLAMMSQLSEKQINRIGAAQGGLDTQKKLNEIKELKNVEDERARALQASNNASMQQAKVMQEQRRTAAMQAIEEERQKQVAVQQTAVATKAQANDTLAMLNEQRTRARMLQRENLESANAYKFLAEQEKTAAMQAIAGEKEKQIAIQQTINEIKRMAKAYKMMPTAIRTTGVNNLLQQSQGAVTINQRITAYKNLQNAVKDLDRTEQGWQTNLQKLNAEIERQKRELSALGVSLENTKRQQRSLAEMATYLAKRMMVLFGIDQIKNYATRLVEIRGEFELENKSLQILLQNKVKANELWEKTVALAVESPFRVKELVSYTKQLAAYRIETDQLYGTTKRLADVSAGLGVDMQRLILAYGQVKAASFLRGCLGYGTPIKKANGDIVEVQDIKVGDKLLNENNEIVNVLELIRGREQMYVVRQENGIEYRVNENHILTLEKNGTLHDVYIKDWDSSYLGVRSVDGRLETTKISICKDKVDDYFGFVLDGNKRFQLGDGTITHNTELRQFTEAGIPMLEELAKYFTEIEGKAVSVGDVFEMISKRMVKFSDVEEVFRRMTDAGGVFYNMQKEQAETLKGQISNLHDRIDLMMNDIGKSHDTLLKGSIAALGWVVENWKGFAWAIQLTVEAFAVYKVSALIAAANTKKLGVAAAATSGIFDKLELSIQNIGKSIKALNLNPWVLGVTAVATVAYELWAAWDDNQKKLEEIDKDFQKLKDDVAAISSSFNISFNKGDLEEQRRELQKLVELANGQYNMDIEMDIAALNDDEVVKQFLELRNKIESNISEARETAMAFEDNNEFWAKAVTLGIYDTMQDEIDKYKEKSQELMRVLESDRIKISDILGRSSKDLSLTQNKYFEQIQAPKGLEETDFMYYQRISGAVQGLVKEYDNLLNKGDRITDAERKQLEVMRNIFTQTQLNGTGYKNMFSSVTKQSNEAKAMLEKFADSIRRDFTITEEHIDALTKKRIESLSKAERDALDDKSIKAIRDKVFDELKNAQELKLKLAIDEIGTANNFDAWQKEYLTSFLNQEFNLSIGINPPDKNELPEWAKRFNKAFQTKFAAYKVGIDEKQYNVTPDEIESRYKNLYEEQQKIYDRMLANAPIYMTKEYKKNLEATKNMVDAYKEVWHWFTGGVGDKNNKGRKDTKDWWSELVKVIGDAHKEFVKLNEQLDKADAKSLAIERFKNVYAEVAKNLKVSLKPLQEFNLETEDGIKAAYEYLLTKLPASAKNARVEIEKQLSDIKGEAKVKVATEANVELKQQIENMFSGYELQLELDKMGFPPEMANLLFNVKPTNIESIREAINKEYANATSQADIKNRDELLKKLSDMEDKQMKENFKKYSEYLIKAQNERVKLKLDELNKLAEVEKTFTLTQQVAAKRFGIKPEQWQKYKETGTWEQSGLSEVQIANITAYVKELNDAAAMVRKSLTEETDKKMAKLDWQDFKGSEMYIEIFQNLENTSTKSINAILEQLRSLKGSLKDLSPTEVKEIVSAMTKAEEEIESRRGAFKALISDTKEYIKLLKERKANEQKLVSLQGQQEAAETMLKSNQLAYAQLMDSYSKLAADPNADKTKLENLITSLAASKATMDDSENTLKSIISQIEKLIALLNKTEKLGKNIGGNLKDIGEGFTQTGSVLGQIVGLFGELSPEAQKLVDTIQNVGGFLSSLGDVMLNPQRFTSWLGLLSTGISLFARLFNNDDEWEERIKEQERLINRLQRAYDNLSESINNALSIPMLRDYSMAAARTLEQQINARRAQINAEMQKKDADKDKIIQWQNEIEDMQKQIAEIQKKNIADMGGFGSAEQYKSAAEQFVDAWFDAYKQTGSGLSGLQDTFEDFYENIVKKQMLMRGLDKLIEPVLKQIDAIIGDDYVVTEDGAEKIKRLFEEAKPKIDEYLKSYADYFGIGKDLGLSDLQKGIQNITEAQAAAIESYLNSIRFYVSAQLDTIKAIQSSIKAPDYSPIVSELKAQTSILRDIYDTLSSVVGRGGSVHSGAYLKVYM